MPRTSPYVPWCQENNPCDRRRNAIRDYSMHVNIGECFDTLDLADGIEDGARWWPVKGMSAIRS